jgi:hypothetical protein
MPRSNALTAEIAAMSRLESAYQAIEDLPEQAKRRVRKWAHDTYPAPEIADLANAVRKALAGDINASDELIHSAAALADAVDGQHAHE